MRTSRERTDPEAGARHLVLALALFVLLRFLLLVLLVPPWLAPDESGHFEVAALLHRHGGALPPGRDEALRLAITQSMDRNDFWRRAGTARHVYPSQQDRTPSGYYRYMAALMPAAIPETAIDLQLLWMRLMNLPLAAAFLGAIWLFGRLTCPRDPPAALAAVGFVALLPQWGFLSATVNPDHLANLLTTLSFVAVAASLRLEGAAGWAALGAATLAIILGLMVKRTALFALVPLLIAAPWRLTTRLGRSARAAGPLRATLGLGGAAALAAVAAAWLAVLLMALWSAELITAAGWLGRFVADLARGLDNGGGLPWRTWVRGGAVLFATFWQAFGYLGQRLSPGWYLLFGGLTIAATVGWAVLPARGGLCSGNRNSHRHGPPPFVLWSATVFVIAAVEVAVHLLGRPIPATQGRYLYPGLAPIACFFVLGWAGLAPARRRQIWAAAGCALLAANGAALLGPLLVGSHG